MRTNVVLDDALVGEAFKFSKARTKRQLIHQALEEFVAHHKRKNPLELVGRVEIADDYDYKVMRERGG